MDTYIGSTWIVIVAIQHVTEADPFFVTDIVGGAIVVVVAFRSYIRCRHADSYIRLARQFHTLIGIIVTYDFITDAFTGNTNLVLNTKVGMTARDCCPLRRSSRYIHPKPDRRSCTCRECRLSRAFLLGSHADRPGAAVFQSAGIEVVARNAAQFRVEAATVDTYILRTGIVRRFVAIHFLSQTNDFIVFTWHSGHRTVQ